MRTAEAMQGKEWFVLSHYGFHRTNSKHQDCPLCNGKKKFRLSEYNGRPSYICVCSNGSAIDLIVRSTGKPFQVIANEIDQLIGNTQDYEKKAVFPERDYIEKWKTYEKVKGTGVEQYLNNRGLFDIPARAMKVQKLNDLEVMKCIATTNEGVPVIEHNTYTKNGRKADVEIPKKTIKLDKDKELFGSVAVRLFDVQTCLGIAEGIETALSAHRLYECATWATLNSGFMKKFRAPKGVEHLMIFADSDSNGTGHAAAFECARANMLANNDVKRVTVRWPEVGDFNDVLNEVQNIHEWGFSK